MPNCHESNIFISKPWQVGQFSYWRKDVHCVLVNHFGLSLPRINVIRLTGHLDMTTDVDYDNKPQHNNIINNNNSQY